MDTVDREANVVQPQAEHNDRQYIRIDVDLPRVFGDGANVFSNSPRTKRDNSTANVRTLFFSINLSLCYRETAKMWISCPKQRGTFF